MKLTLLAKDPTCWDRNCPSVYVDESGGLVVQGVQLSDADLRDLRDPGSGETAVRIDPAIVAEAMARYATERQR
ncbi:hypothetical protein ACFO4E_21350 [Nocardiopsis mangrovi]|uniref:DUF397 domain-containing protein n=1 Tax=Nocardiopsis mangrovi TaxID=1179818 RepID=A0ABV9DZT7_9ACTN